MKRMGALLLGAVTVTLMIAVFAGCGSVQDQARGYMKKGDSIIQKSQKQSTELGTRIQQVFTEDFTAEGKPDVSKFTSDIEQIKELDQSLVKQFNSAKTEYEKIKPLKGVPDYVEYANLMTQMIDLQVKGIDQINAYLDGAVKQASSSSYDPSSLLDYSRKTGNDIQALSDQSDALLQKAQQLQNEKKLL